MHIQACTVSGNGPQCFPIEHVVGSFSGTGEVGWGREGGGCCRAKYPCHESADKWRTS